MRNTLAPAKPNRSPLPDAPRFSAAVAVLLCIALTVQGCFDPVYPQLDRETRVMEALNIRDTRSLPPSPLSPSEAVVYALANNLDARVAELETAYHSESAVAARRRLLPTLNVRYSMEHSNHPSARWSESTRTGSQSLESSYSSDPNSRQGEVGLMWNLIDFGVGYLRARQQGERIRHSAEQQRRVRQQVVLDVLSNYWRASAAAAIAADAESIRKELEEQAEAVRDSVEMRILTGAEGARRELAVQGGLAELEQWQRAAVQAKLELGRVLGSGNALDFILADFPEEPPELPPLPGGDPNALQAAALQRRPELFQQDAQERIAVDEARLALLQMAPNATLSLSVYDDPDKFLEWGNWMTVGARVSWNLFNIPARVSERRMAKLQEETAKQKGLALAAGIMAQVGIAYSEWRVSHDYAAILAKRADARGRLVEALAAGEKDGQTRPGEVLQERVRLLSEKAASLRANAEARIAGARLANAIGLDVDDCGRLLWKIGSEDGVDLLYTPEAGFAKNQLMRADAQAAVLLPEEMSGLTVVKAEDFLTPDSYFTEAAARQQTAAAAAPVPSPEKSAETAALPDGAAAAAAEPASEEYVSYAKHKPHSSETVAGPEPDAYPERSLPDAPAAEPFGEEPRNEAPRPLAPVQPVPALMAEAVQLPPPLEEGVYGTGGYEYGFDSGILADLAQTAYSEDIGNTHISESVPHLMQPEMAAAAPSARSASAPVPAAGPQRQPEAARERSLRPASAGTAVPSGWTPAERSVPAAGAVTAAMPAMPRVEYPEEIQAQTPPSAEGFSDMRKVPLTSFIGPEMRKPKTPPARPAAQRAAPAPARQPMPQQRLEITSSESFERPPALPPGSLRPPDPREQQRLDALAPLKSLEITPAPASVSPVSSSSLRPPPAGPAESLTPPASALRPGNFAAD